MNASANNINERLASVRAGALEYKELGVTRSPAEDTLLQVSGYWTVTTGMEIVPLSGAGIEIPNTGRQQLAEMLGWMGFNRGAEIGVKRGEYSEVLLKANPELILCGVDPFLEYEAYRVISHQQQSECREIAKARLAPYSERYTFIEKPSVEAAGHFMDDELDFVFIDASHKLEDVIADIAVWSRVVRPGGAISGHDYLSRKHGRGGGPNTSHHVKRAVGAYTQAYGIDPWFVLGRKVKREGEVRDKERSWLWVKR